MPTGRRANQFNFTGRKGKDMGAVADRDEAKWLTQDAARAQGLKLCRCCLKEWVGRDWPDHALPRWAFHPGPANRCPWHQYPTTLKEAARRAGQAMPPWVDTAALDKVYRFAGKRRMQVDHIIPLQHPLVSGLHVPWNLQELTPRQNMAKGSHFEGGSL
jgi:hypothetical protein